MNPEKKEKLQSDFFELANRVAVLEKTLADRETYWQAGTRGLDGEIAQLRHKLARVEMSLSSAIGIETRLRAIITELQSQLEFSLVSSGLPTKPGMYEFLSPTLNIHVFTHEPDITTYPWTLIGGDGGLLDDTEIRDSYTHYRRVELPKEKVKHE